MIEIGEMIPNALVGLIVDDEVQKISMQDLVNNKTVLIVGFPGVHTPICTHQHIPSLIAKYDSFVQSGIDDVYCISDDNFWALRAWSQSIDGADKLNFISDGNREFLLKAGISRGEDEVFLGGKYGRFYIFVRNGIVVNYSEEETVFSTDATNGERICDDVYRMMI